MDLNEQVAPDACAETLSLERSNTNRDVRSLRVCIDGCWATDEELEDMLAKGEEWVARRRAEGVIR